MSTAPTARSCTASVPPTVIDLLCSSRILHLADGDRVGLQIDAGIEAGVGVPSSGTANAPPRMSTAPSRCGS